MSDDSYVTSEVLRTFAYQCDEGDLKFLEDSLPRVSRIFDKLCGCPAGYFLPAANEATTKVIYGSGSQLLPIPPFTGSDPTITLPDNYTAPKFIARQGYLLTTDANGFLQTGTRTAYPVVWPASVPISVTARWGFEKVPDDVVEAVAELAIAIWRSKDTAFLKAINLETMSVVAEAVPKRVAMIAASYRASSQIPAFV